MTKEQQEVELIELFAKAKEILLKKGNDYANKDRLSNFKFAGQICGLTASQQCLSMISVKVARLGNLLQPNAKPNNESVQDSIVDLFNYSALLYMIENENVSQ